VRRALEHGLSLDCSSQRDRPAGVRAKGQAHEQGFSRGPHHLGRHPLRQRQRRAASASPSSPAKPVIKDGQVQKDGNGYTETWDEFHTVKAFNGLGKSVGNHKKKGDELMVVGEIRYSRNERDGRTYYNTDIVAEEIKFI
jgi:single-strand DNA-binding protein